MKYRFWIVTLVLCISIMGCGYRFIGEKNFPFQIKAIFVPVFENKTSEFGIETIITNDFIYEFSRSSNVKVAEKDSADAVLYGVISSLSTHTISRSDIQSPLERRVVMVFDLKLVDMLGQVLWVSRGFSDHESYTVLPDKLLTEGSRHRAIKTLSKRMAEKVYYRLMDIE